MLGQLSIFSPDKTLPLRQRVSVELITLEQARYALIKFHYLHRARVGRQLNYAVLIDGVVDGVITFAYPMVSVPIADIPSDEVIEFARMFLYQNIPHSATCAIGKVLKRVKADWMRLFPESKTPRLIVSWSDTVIHKGTIYKASNFKFLRRTKADTRKETQRNKAGSRRGVRIQREDYKHDKDCWIYPI